MRKLITIILVLAASVAFGQTTYQLNYDSIRVGKTTGSGATSLYGKTYLKNATEGAPSDSVLTVRNGRVYKIAGSAISSVGFLTYVFSRTASDISGYEQMPALTSYTIGSADTATVAATTTPAIIQEFATNTGFPNTTLIPAGVFNVTYQTQKNSGSQSYYTYAIIYKRNLAGAETAIATTNNSSSVSANTVQTVNVSAVSPSDISLLTTDRVVVKVFAVMVTGTANISIYYDDATDSRLAFPSALVDATNFVPYNGAIKDFVSAFSITGDSIKRVGGTGSQFLMGNGTVQDTTTIQTVSNFFPKGDTRYAKIGDIPTLGTSAISLGGTTNGLSYSGGNYRLHKVTATTGGVFTTATDTIAGNKRFKGVISVENSNGINVIALSGSQFGYSTPYDGLKIGTTGSASLFFNVDVSSNLGGGFTGDGSEYIWRNTGSFKTPNAANNNYNTLLSWDSAGGITIPTLTATNPITGSISGNAGTVTTNANLTGPITSVGNATSVASQTGTGSTFAMSVSPTFTGTVNVAGLSASGTITSTKVTSPIFTNTSASTGSKYFELVNTGAQLYWGNESSAGASVVSGAPAYSSFISTGNATDLVFGTNLVKRVSINGSTGNLTASTLTLTSGASNGYVLKSDGTGNASWQPATSSYKGTWNASTNTPTVADGVGATGDYYEVSTSGTQFGRSFTAGGRAIYNGSIWEPVGVSASVTSVNGYTGVVTLAKSDIGLSNVDNTTDAAKPVSTATQTALDLKANIASPTFTGTTTTDVFVNSSTTPSVFKNSGSSNFNAIELRGGSTGSTQNWELSKDKTVSNSIQLTPSTALGGSTYTSPVFTLGAAGDLTLASTISATNFSGSSSGTNTGDQTTITGNAGTATALQTARNIQGVSFNGTADINPINGTGFVKATGTTLSYDNTTYAPLNSPTFTGTPTLPTGTIAVTQSPGNNSTAVATTAYVDGLLGYNGISSSTYNPTYTSGTNTSGITGSNAHYLRIGNEVKVQGRASLTTSSSGASNFTISLPFASSLTVGNQLLGNGTADTNSTNPVLYAETTTDTAVCEFTAVAGASMTIYYSFTYTIIN